MRDARSKFELCGPFYIRDSQAFRRDRTSSSVRSSIDTQPAGLSTQAWARSRWTSGRPYPTNKTLLISSGILLLLDFRRRLTRHISLLAPGNRLKQSIHPQLAPFHEVAPISSSTPETTPRNGVLGWRSFLQPCDAMHTAFHRTMPVPCSTTTHHMHLGRAIQRPQLEWETLPLLGVENSMKNACQQRFSFLRLLSLGIST